MKRPLYISSSSMTPAVTPLVPAPEYDIPSVYYLPKVWQQIEYIIQENKHEVGWLGLIEELDSGDFLITDIYIPEQTVHAAETDIAAEAMAAITMQILNEGKDPALLRYWGHSHVNMAVSPSTTDELQIESYLEHSDFFIRGIYNKKGESKVDIYDKAIGLIFQRVPDSLYVEPLEDSEYAALDELLRLNVKTQTFFMPQPQNRHLQSRMLRNGFQPYASVDYWDDWDDRDYGESGNRWTSGVHNFRYPKEEEEGECY